MSLLRTKIQLPPLRAQHIQRGRVLQHLQESTNQHARLTLVSAPAGFGKSSILIEWAHHLRKQDFMVAWYALDERDNDPARFGAYFLGAFQQVSGFPPLTDDTKQMALQETFHHILNTAADLESQLILILDDYHLITEPQLHHAIGLMAEHLPTNMRLALGTRADPPLQLARLRTQGAITEVRMADLRFDRDEMAAWLQAMLGWTPSERLLQQLDGLTEGWAAALALILMNQTLTDEQTLETHLTRFSLTRRHIFDYFAQEVFERQSEVFKDFLLDTSVLDWFNPDLCCAVTAKTNAPLILSQLAARSLFIVPLSEDEPLYRYHHLFEQFLRQYLEMTDRTRYLQKHHQAAVWHAAHNNLVEAVHHALASEDFDDAAKLIEVRAWEALTSRGEITTIMNWLPQFSDEVLKRLPRLCLYFSRALYLSGDTERAQHYLQLAIDTLKDGGGDIPNRQALQTIAFNYQATLAAYLGDIESGLHWIEQANARRHTVEALDCVRITNTDAFLRYLLGDVLAARHAYQQALEQAQRIQHHYLMLDAHYYLAQIDLLAGELDAVEVRCQTTLAQYSSKLGPMSALMLPLATVQLQRNLIVEAEMTLRDAITLARRANIPDLLWFAYLTLADVLLVRGKIAEAEAIMVHAQGYARGFHSPMMAALISAVQARLMLRLGQIDAAVEWATGYQHVKKPGYHHDYEDITLAQTWLAQGSYHQALGLLAQIIESAETGGRYSYVIMANLLRALAYQALGDIHLALAALEQVLPHARRQGYVRLFLDAGQPMLNLLRLAIEHDIQAANYAAYLLDTNSRTVSGQHPADMLTEREIEVLNYMSAGASNQAIAAALVISLGTVKSHIHHIMSKLDAQNRTEAVSKARSLNILAD